MNTRTTLRILIAIIFAYLLALFLYQNVFANEPTIVDTYGCNSLYTSDNPDILAEYMVELIGHQPVKTTLEAFVSELPCDNLDVGRIIFNVCGFTGDQHQVCTAWSEVYSHFYSDEFYYTYYANTLLAAQPQGNSSIPITSQQTSEETDAEVEDGFSINIIHVLFILAATGALLYIRYNRSIHKSTPNDLEV